MKNLLLLLPLLLLCLLLSGCRNGDEQGYEFRIPGMVLNIDASGKVSRIEFTDKNLVREINAFSRLAGCEPVGRVKVTRKQDQISFRRKWVSKATGNSCILTDRFRPGNGSVSWEVEIAGLQGPWTTPVETRLDYPGADQAKFWTAWGDPRLGEISK
ncbi:MAG: hypothetical protein NTV01_04775, partial [Bacteroidia bacterium]|nr:hypothetical protein [Bacteroidia bacterium]